jgi:hypothetical protein
MDYFRVRNYEKFQHYKKRSPPWIKLHRSIFQNYEISLLPDSTKAHLFAIWLLASEHNNAIPWDEEWIGRRINATEKVNLDMLRELQLIEKIKDKRKRRASIKRASRKQSAIPETETERESEGEEKKKAASLEFDQFKLIYETNPRGRCNWKKAKEAWNRLIKAGENPTMIIQAAKHYCLSNDPQFRMASQRFLNSAGEWKGWIDADSIKRNESGRLRGGEDYSKYGEGE